MANPNRFIIFAVLAGIAVIILFATHLSSPNEIVIASTEEETLPVKEEFEEGILENDHYILTEEIHCTIPDSYPELVLQWCETIEENGIKNNIDPKLIAAVILQESGGQADAYSASGAVGLMQVMPRDGIAASFQCINGPCFSSRPTMNELFDPEFNIEFGSKMLMNLIATHGNLRDALKYYGPMNVGYYYADIILNIYENYK